MLTLPILQIDGKQKHEMINLKSLKIIFKQFKQIETNIKIRQKHIILCKK